MINNIMTAAYFLYFSFTCFFFGKADLRWAVIGA
jgi:hypothetical protein